jgi:hypothetical protein
LLGSVAGEASGVLVTRDVDDVMRDPRGPSAYWTITLSPGVGGGVEGEASETTLVPANGQETRVLLSSARTVWSKRLGVAGGIQEDPVAGDEQLLTDARLADLRTVVERIDRLYPASLDARGRPMPWDIEFGFVGDRTVLFQIRPFIVGKTTASLPRARALDEAMQARAPLALDLDAEIIQ